MTRGKAIVLNLAVGTLAVSGALVVVYRNLGAVDDWVGRQLAGIANVYLVPRLNFDRLRYERPGTVVVTGATLTAPDSTTVADLGTLTVTLAEVPLIGRPIVIERLTVERGSVNLIRDPSTGAFKGLVPILKVTPRDKAAREAVPEEFRLSRVFRLRKIALRDCGVRFDAGTGSPPMVLAGITTDLDIAPAPGGAEPGWYTLSLVAGRAPSLRADLNGRFNIDTLTMQLDKGDLSIKVDANTLATLPPELQKWLGDHEATGQAAMSVNGTIPLLDPGGSDARATIALSDFRFAAGDYRFPIDRLRADLALSRGIATIDPCTVDLLGGQVSASARVDRGAPDRPCTFQWQAEGLDLAQLQRSHPAEGQPPRLAGRFASKVHGQASLAGTAVSLDGSGDAHVREGRLVILPGLSKIADLLGVGVDSKVNHTADAEFGLTSAGVRVTKSQVTTDYLGARATGLVGFDGSLDLSVNAGPLERLQSALGKVGQVLGAITDNLIGYRVRGTLTQPIVSVEGLPRGP